MAQNQQLSNFSQYVTVNTAGNTVTFNTTVGLVAVSANGSLGTANQVLTSNGTAVYWANAGGGFTNGQSISVNALAITGAVTANGSTGTANQVLTTDGSGVYWANSGGGFTNGQSISVNAIVVTGSFTANGSTGSSGQVLTSSGSGLYWTTPATGGGGGTGATFKFDTDQFTGNGSVNTYSLSKTTTTNNVLVFINGVEQVPNSAYTVSGSNITFSSNISNGAIVEVRIPTFDTYSGSIADFETYVFTASNNQTTFTGTDNNAKTLSYVPGYLSVFLNGVKLVNTTDYAANNGSSIVLTAGASNNDILEVVSQAFLTLDPQVIDSYLIGNTTLITSNNLTTSNTTQQNVDSFAANTYRSASYFVQVTDNTNNEYHAQNITLIHNGSAVSMSEFGAVYSANSLATFDATINTGIVYLQVTPVTANSTIRVARTAMVV